MVNSRIQQRLKGFIARKLTGRPMIGVCLASNVALRETEFVT
jgi:hypothetical protein